MHQKDQPPEEEEFSSLDRLMSLEQSDGDRYRGEQDIWPADQNEAEGPALLHSQPNGMSISEWLNQILSAFKKEYQKKTKAIQRNWTHRTPSRIRFKKDH